MNAPIVVLGAELQPSVSMALSRPDLQFVFISERDVIDGWDLGNVEIRKDNTERFQFDAAVRHIVLSPVWLRCVGDNANRFALSSVIAKLAKTFSNWVLPVSNYPLQEGWVLKGDLFHRPDAILDGEGGSRAESSDPYGCCNVYQRQLRITATILSMGYRTDSDRCAVGVVRVHSEAFAREDFLIAGESIEEQQVESRTRLVLDALDYTGYFSVNWVIDADKHIWMTSFRPVPRALFQLFRAGGIDLLAEPPGRTTLKAGLRFIVDYHYESYR